MWIPAANSTNRLTPLMNALSPALKRLQDRRMQASLLLVFGCLLLLPFGDLDVPQNVGPFLAGGFVMSLGFLAALRVPGIPVVWFWTVTIGTRLILIWMTPSDDIYRYIWEGEVQNRGFSPYCLAPSSEILAPMRNHVWQLVKFQEVTAIYPPLAELVLRFATSISATVIWLKLLFVAADLLTCGMLAQRFGCTRALTFAWNPLVLYCFAGGGHYDSVFVLSLTAAWLLWDRKGGSPDGRLASVACLGAGVALKWLCVPLLGWELWQVGRRDGLKRALRASIVAVLPLAASWAVVSAGSWSCSVFPRDFVKVARSAEALPAVAAWILSPEHSFNRNDFYLGIFLLVSVFLLSRQQTVRGASQAVLAAALLITPMFHAWYATWLVPFAVVDRNRGAITLSISSFVYFWLHHAVGQPGGIWKQSVAEKLLLWGPFVIGLAWQKWGRRQMLEDNEHGRHATGEDN